MGFDLIVREQAFTKKVTMMLLHNIVHSYFLTMIHKGHIYVDNNNKIVHIYIPICIIEQC